MRGHLLLIVYVLFSLLFVAASPLCAQNITIINNYGDTTGVGKDNLRLRSSTKHTLVINYYEPAPKGEIDRLDELIGQSLDFYIDQVVSVDNEKIGFRKPKSQVFNDLNNIVRDAIRYFNFKQVKDFDGFSDRVKSKIDALDGLEWRKSPFYVRDADEATRREMLYYFVQDELNSLKLLANTEVGNYSNDNLLTLTETAIKGLSPAEQEALLKEISNFNKNDLLQPVEVDLSTATVTLLASEDEFVLNPQGDRSEKGPSSDEFEERILRLIEQNNQRLERLEEDVAALRSERTGTGKIPSLSPGSDPVMQSQIDELRLMLSELLRRERPPTTAPDLSGQGQQVYNLPDRVIFNFEKASSSLDLSSRLMLNEIIDILAHNPGLNLMITGFADRLGDRSTNMELSRKRAKTVRDYLIAQGISGNRLIMNYFGDRDSYAPNPGDRRVELEFLKY